MLSRTLVLSTGVLFVFLFLASCVQTKTLSDSDMSYVLEAGKRVAVLQQFFDATSNVFNNTGTITDAKKIHVSLGYIVTKMEKETPPLDLVAYQSQFRFAALYCGNIDTVAEDSKDATSSLVVTPVLIMRINCINQIQAARLRLIDVAAAYGINPLK